MRALLITCLSAVCLQTAPLATAAQTVDGRQLLELLSSADHREKVAGRSYVLGVIDAAMWESGKTHPEHVDACFALAGTERAETLGEVVRQFLVDLEAQQHQAFLEGFPARRLVRGALAEQYPCRRSTPSASMQAG
jgi:hypothetical protein